MGKQTTAILDAIATTVLLVKQKCFADAVAAFSLSVQNADVVTISGLNATNTATSNNGGCKRTSDIEMRSLFGSLTDTLNKIVQASQEMQGQKTSFIATLTQSLNVNVVETCYASAIASVNITVQNIGGNVTFDNVTINNTARATIANCLQSVQVKTGGGSLPMKQFIENNESWMTPDQSSGSPAASPASTPGSKLTPQQLDAARQKIFPCSSQQTQKQDSTADSIVQQAMSVPLTDIWGATAVCAAVAFVGVIVSFIRSSSSSTKGDIVPSGQTH